MSTIAKELSTLPVVLSKSSYIRFSGSVIIMLDIMVTTIN